MDNISQQHEAPSKGTTIGFTIKQQQALLALLNNSASANAPIVHHLNTSYVSPSSTINLTPTSNSIDHQWILDILATYHVCHSAHMFTHLICIKPILVKLLNGNIIQTNQACTTYFTDNFYLTNVLYIPSFCTNFIYVPRMTNNIQCHVIFNAHQCFIQGTPTLKKICATELQYGLYVLTYPTLQHTLNHVFHVHSTITNKCNLWHQCLSHPSNDNMHHINKKFLMTPVFKSPTHTIFVCMLNKRGFLFLTALLLPNIALNLFIWIFWAFFLHLLCLAIDIFLLL